ncbi:ABC transporter ATP-binding protein [Myroides odoratimimus]|uniref:ABC transporter ATP-binding protein n=1 Tax=Myroides odoratimimus TaxID=76832 RepID=UPI001CE076F0|nr:ABC transporter ATP-binding protein [Myroides odoratimimus]MCA4806663.1 ABC transporter ATP-binding protein [Myroides odoratimimus]MDM1399625.1 ABC transporter ATP-binding protein [Myroides odoratimimus]MDM1454505.1 ABC transporter ATP-binding protein [Myroides odoratimimus]MDM1463093.1 ABC transporter ATP-binding protein [Myroides odoratimimus]MDM1473092.1 ABC transporter ATP-binding protein [Myroides odoratimimus]
MSALSQLNKYFYKYKYRFLIGVIITIVAQIFTLYTPKLVGDSIRTLEQMTVFDKGEVTSILLNNILWILITTLIAGFLTFLMRQTLIVMSRHIEFDLKNDVFKHYEVLSQSFYKRNRTGDLMNRISEDVGKVRQYVGPAVMYSINTLIRFAVVLTQMYLISPQLTLYSLVPLPLLGYFIYKLSKQINERSSIFQANLSKLTTFSQEMFSGIRVIKAYSIEQEKQDEFRTLTQESKDKYLNLAKSSALIAPLMIFLIGLSNLVVIAVGALMFFNGSIPDIGIIAQFILYINMLTWPIASIGWVSSMIQEAEASQKRINEFLNEQPEIYNTNPNPTNVEGNITFDKVSYTYEDTGIQALKDVSFTLEKGKTLAILGKTGSGKSTLLTLISRMYDVTSGNIYIDNTPIKDCNLKDLRNSIAVVPQDALLFSDTISNNIRFGKEDATEEEIIEVAKKAVVHDNITQFNEGYNTTLGERGLTLSGGQKQRVSIARALIKDAPILILDDALSAVDTETEEKILQNLEEHSKEITTLIVTHRVSSAKNADQIIVLDHGQIVEQGTHNELIHTEGYYRELYQKQLNEKELL